MFAAVINFSYKHTEDFAKSQELFADFTKIVIHMEFAVEENANSSLADGAPIERPTPKLKELADRLKVFVKSSGLTRRAFAEQLGIGYHKLASYLEAKAEPGNAFWVQVATQYPTADVGYLMTGVERWIPIPSTAIPIVDEITAGELRQFIDERHIGETNSSYSSDPDMFALKVKGDSMHPEIEEGDLVICAPHRPFVSGRIYACLTADGETTVKRVFRRGGHYDLVPTNENFPTMTIFAAGIVKLYRVVEIQRSV